MKKITLLMSFIACVVFAQAQTNLLVNPGFETWTNGTAPDGWTLGTASAAAISPSTSIFNEGSKSFKVLPTTVVASQATYSVSQIIPITAEKTYTLKMSYYIETGDGTDARVWSDWCNVGTTTTYATLSHADSVLLMGPGGGAAYFPDVRGAWKTYTCDVVAPTGFASFSFQFRTYKSPAVVYWDNMFFGEKIASGINSPTVNPLIVSVKGNTLTVESVVDGTSVEIYSTLGAKVQTSTLQNSSIQLNNLSKGLYVVRVGNQSTKIMI